MHVKPNTELRVLACIHRPDDILAVIDLLDASCATKENPIGVYVLHLIELIAVEPHQSLYPIKFRRRASPTSPIRITKWSMDGNVELEDNMVRALNLSVLERAPCSVAILVNRGYAGRAGSMVSLETYMYSVCMIFLGGKDNREALI
ncbi:hypothetical protein TIFTF001_013660 [Ficus carica]|uniref:Uncharacterized protein n=1 Tax=Ficus carica TaxID=3494 RepID=A0AA88A2G1_FICCA|nr:hypothetical protein TIFTF001_013660 [Ficus carica]